MAKLRNITGKKLKKNRKAINRLANEMGENALHTYTVERWIDDNKKNGPLTTVTALKIIQEELKLTQEEILTEQ